MRCCGLVPVAPAPVSCASLDVTPLAQEVPRGELMPSTACPATTPPAGPSRCCWPRCSWGLKTASTAWACSLCGAGGGRACFVSALPICAGTWMECWDAGSVRSCCCRPGMHHECTWSSWCTFAPPCTVVVRGHGKPGQCSASRQPACQHGTGVHTHTLTQPSSAVCLCSDVPAAGPLVVLRWECTQLLPACLPACLFTC